jgi:hypothetical protein
VSRTLWLIAEHRNDADVVVEILKKRGIPVNINPVSMPDNKSGINHMLQELAKLIETTQAARQADDRIAVLIDAEWYKLKRDRYNHKQVAAICRRFRPDVKLLWAVQEIEAWLLADSGVCAWLGIEVQQTDPLHDPKEKLSSLLHHRGLSSRGRGRSRIFQQMRGDGDQHNRSLGRVLRYIDAR